MNRFLRTFSLLFVTVLPWPLKRIILTNFFGYSLHVNARIGLAYLDVEHVRMEAGSYIGPFTVIRNLHSLVLAEKARIGTFNWIFGMIDSGDFFKLEIVNRRSELSMGRGASITSRHLVDCIDRVEIGDFATVAGFRSQILTHSIDIHANRQSCAPVKIGAFCFVGTGVIILPGGALPDRSVLAAGSTLTDCFVEESAMYAGTPAIFRKSISSSSLYFNRSEPAVI